MTCRAIGEDETAMGGPVRAARKLGATASNNAPRVRVRGAEMMSSAVRRAVITALGYARGKAYTIHLWI